MRTTSLKFVVHGDSYEELTSAADAAINRFLGSSDYEEEEFEDNLEEYEDRPQRHTVNYELVVTENPDVSSEYQYTAEVIARIKDVKH